MALFAPLVALRKIYHLDNAVGRPGLEEGLEEGHFRPTVNLLTLGEKASA